MNIKLILLLFISLIFNSQIIPQNIFKQNIEAQKTDEIDKKTKNCDVYEGLFNIYQSKKDGKSYIEIDTSHLDNEFIYFSYIENGVIQAGAVKGSYRGSKIIKINKYYNKIDFTIKNTKYYFEEDSPLSKASNTNINTPIIISEEIIAKNKDKTKFLINADNIFLNESLQQIRSSYSGGYKGFKIGNLSKTKTRYNKIRNYPENTDVVVNYFYESKYPSSRGGGAITDSRNVSILVQHSLIKMPDDNYNTRNDDSRVGFFTTQTNHMTSTDQVNYRDFINRWRLEKKYPEKVLSEPVKPIVWWIENTTPYEFRDIIKEGVESWNIAFKEAGFINAIQVKIQPDTATWDAGDIRYNVLRWTSSPRPPWGGYGPSFVNPKTGEILGADIMLEWVYLTNRIVISELYNESNSDLTHAHAECFAAYQSQIENGFGLNYIKTMNLSEQLGKDLIKQSLYRLVLHEVGHTLGLNHNFKGSLLLSNDELNDKEIVNKNGICSSVMEYPAINITKNYENQGLFYDIKPGPYDIWAVQYGYTQLNDTIEQLDKILSRSTEKSLAFGNDADDMRYPGKGMDPNAMINDLSSEPVEHSIDRMEMILSIFENLKERYTNSNDTYEELTRAHRTLFYSYFQSLDIISRQIGGVNVDRSSVDQQSTKDPFMPVSKELQKKAMQVIQEYGFSNKILLDKEFYSYLQSQRRGFQVSTDPKILQMISSSQNRLLSHLLHRTVLQRISNTTLYGNSYDLTEYMIDLRNSIFQDDVNTNISITRQNLQLNYINKLISIIDQKSKFDNISKSSAYYNLNWIKSNLNISSGNISTRQHKQYLVFLIESIQEKK
jgi:hypothetical protein